MPSQYPWYEIVPEDSDLEQGDIFFGFPSIIVERNEEGETEENTYEADIIVITQSCDLQNKDLDVILWCPLYLLEEKVLDLIDSPTERAILSAKESLRKGEYIQFFLLNSGNIQGIYLNYHVVDLKNPRSTPYEEFDEYRLKHGPRLRLLSPYKEHLSQSFARVFMRVGLPNGIPQFKRNPP